MIKKLKRSLSRKRDCSTVYIRLNDNNYMMIDLGYAMFNLIAPYGVAPSNVLQFDTCENLFDVRGECIDGIRVYTIKSVVTRSVNPEYGFYDMCLVANDGDILSSVCFDMHREVDYDGYESMVCAPSVGKISSILSNGRSTNTIRSWEFSEDTGKMIQLKEVKQLNFDGR